MNKHIPRVLQPGSIWYCVVLLAFTVAAALLDQYYLAAAELAVTLVVFAVSRIRFIRRKHILMDYVQSATDAIGISVHAGTPFPMAVIRLPDNEIIWGNPGFYSITGLSDATRYQTMDSVIPGFSTTWLREGRSELPGDQTILGRRYRVYGNYVRSEDDATTVMLATIFFADLTEMFHIRDALMRTRPLLDQRPARHLPQNRAQPLSARLRIQRPAKAAGRKILAARVHPHRAEFLRHRRNHLARHRARRHIV